MAVLCRSFGGWYYASKSCCRLNRAERCQLIDLRTRHDVAMMVFALLQEVDPMWASLKVECMRDDVAIVFDLLQEVDPRGGVHARRWCTCHQRALEQRFTERRLALIAVP